MVTGASPKQKQAPINGSDKKGKEMPDNNRELIVPLVCPHCDWSGSDDNVRIQWERTPNGIRITSGVKWACPRCDMVVHEEDMELNQ